MVSARTVVGAASMLVLMGAAGCSSSTDGAPIAEELGAASSANAAPSTAAGSGVVSWEPCTGIPEDAVAAAQMDGREPKPDSRQHPYVSLNCSFRSSESMFVVNVSANQLTLAERAADERFTTLDETTLSGRDVLISDYPNVSCHYTVAVEPGV
ncbi:MAG: DUF3558 family protein, partial [Rhodococcus sp.]|nr:DUF3558 family protein [Rhodococcus sp. (in: high G+C Gram-positive bacteria)]